MKRNLARTLILIAIGMLGFNSIGRAQSVYKIDESKDMDMKLTGTSTLHKWSMEAKTFSGTAGFGFQAGNSKLLSSLKSLTFSLAVANLKSSESGLNNNAYKALKANDYKDINYKLTSAVVTLGKGNKFLIKTHGKLTIAGVTHEVTMDVDCVVNADATITCTGSEKLNMTDYAIKPPTFMLGAMRTGDSITLDFTVTYKKQS